MNVALLMVNKATCAEATIIFHQNKTIRVTCYESESLCTTVNWHEPINFFRIERLEICNVPRPEFIGGRILEKLLKRNDVLLWLATLPKIKSVVIDCQELFEVRPRVSLTKQLDHIGGATCVEVGRWKLHGSLATVELRHFMLVRFFSAASKVLPVTTPMSTVERIVQLNKAESDEDHGGIMTQEDFKLYELGHFWRFVYQLHLTEYKEPQKRASNMVPGQQAVSLDAFSERIILLSSVQEQIESYGAIEEL